MNKIEELKKFLEKSPQDPFLHYALTMEYVKLKDYVTAKSSFERLINDFPDYVGTYYHFGKLLELLKNQDQALLIYEKGMAIARAKRNFHALNELQGAYNLALGETDDDE